MCNERIDKIRKYTVRDWKEKHRYCKDKMRIVKKDIDCATCSFACNKDEAKIK